MINQQQQFYHCQEAAACNVLREHFLSLTYYLLLLLHYLLHHQSTISPAFHITHNIIRHATRLGQARLEAFPELLVIELLANEDELAHTLLALLPLLRKFAVERHVHGVVDEFFLGTRHG